MPDEHPSAELQGVFARPFNEQVAFFRQKLGNLVPTRAWDDMLAAEHDTGFMVAGATKADLLSDLAAAVDKAIAEGKGIETFRKDFKAIVARHGWTGWTGEGSIGGEAWRVKTIFRTNAYTSYAAGRLAQLKQSNFKFWIYWHGGSLEPRPQHLDWNGLILPADHVFWDTHYPPSDWGCSCYVTGAHSMAAAVLMGGDPSKTLPDGWNAIDPATGAPVGVGRGWDYAPGASVADQVRGIAAKVRHWDYAVAKAFMDELPIESADALADAYRALPTTADDMRSFAKRVTEPGPEPLPLEKIRTLGRLRSDQVEQLRAIAGVDVDGFDFSIDPFSVRHVRENHGNDATERKRGQRGVLPADYAQLPQILSGPDSVTLAKDAAAGEQLIHFVKVIGGERFTATMIVRKGRRTLTLQTLFIGIGKGK